MTPHEHQIVQKARILDCYSNTEECLKKPELEKAKPEEESKETKEGDAESL